MRRQMARLSLLTWLLALAQGGLAFDSNHGPWDRTLKTYTHGGWVDYKTLKADSKTLLEYLEAVGTVKESEYEKWSRSDRIAFWINAYNALTIKAIIDHYPIQPSFSASLRFPENSVRQISGVWDEIKFLVMGRGMTLNEIEHGILRKKFAEPRVHMALVCASIGCPPLRDEAYAGSKLDKQLDDQARKFLEIPARFRIDRQGRHVFLSPIFKWFASDFIRSFSSGKDFPGHKASEQAVLNFIGRYIGEKEAAFLRTGRFDIKYVDYDWSLNEVAR